jgi:hypothetical protein
MKYRTFRNIVSMVLFLALGGTCYGCYAWWQKSLADEEFARRDAALREEAEAAGRRKEEAERLARFAVTATTASTPVSGGVAAWLSASGLREVDRDALTALQRPVTDKIKDAAKGKAWKINVYADDGQRFNRVKIDLDRDEQDDETWTIFADGHIERKVSSQDNGTFDGASRLETSGWVDMTAAPPTTAPPTAPPTATSIATSTPTADGLRPVDRDMFALVASLTPTEKVKDATKGKPYKINLYSDDGQRFNRAKIDLDRDDKWDESWTWKGSDIERQVAPADDERYSEVWVLAGEAWKKKL